MLTELTIKNIALIESLRIPFAQGFNVLTGETGAGKSIVVDSVNLALGGRAERDLIRTGAEKASVQALFDVSGCPKAMEFARELGVDTDDGFLALQRELSRSGRNLCRISGMVVPLSSLRKMAGMLMNVHGQHEQHALLEPNAHMEYVDAFGGAEQRGRIADVAEKYAARAEVAAQLRRILKDAAERERLLDILTFQVNEIESAKLKSGEEERLSKKLALLDSAQRVADAVGEAYALTYGEDSAQELLNRAAKALESISDLDEHFAMLTERLHEVCALTRDVGQELQVTREELDFDPALSEKIAQRLESIHRLERKYGATADDVLNFGREARERLERLNSSEENAENLRRELKVRDKALREACRILTESRNELARELARGVQNQLADLGMGKAHFEIRVMPLEKPTKDGMDAVQLMISTNPGEPMKPVNTVASGGELSRIMLALKAVALDADGVETMVFDEIDTGISGHMAQVVGEKMRLIAQNRQVLCVTHLPQIAALGQNHYLVEKTTDGCRTDSTVRKLDFEGRTSEIARLVGGAECGESAMRHAREMLLAANRQSS